jgi:hypothetical protein
LAHDQPDAAGGGMHQDGLALLYLERSPQQILCGHALQHHRGAGLKSMESGSLTSRSAAITRSVA